MKRQIFIILVACLATVLIGCGSMSVKPKKEIVSAHCTGSKGTIYVEIKGALTPESQTVAENVISKSGCYTVVPIPVPQPGPTMMQPAPLPSPPQTDYIAKVSFQGKSDTSIAPGMIAAGGLALATGGIGLLVAPAALTNTTKDEANVSVALCKRDGTQITAMDGSSKDLKLGFSSASLMDDAGKMPGEAQFGTACLDAWNKLVPAINNLPDPASHAAVSKETSGHHYKKQYHKKRAVQ